MRGLISQVEERGALAPADLLEEPFEHVFFHGRERDVARLNRVGPCLIERVKRSTQWSRKLIDFGAQSPHFTARQTQSLREVFFRRIGDEFRERSIVPR